MERKTGPVCPHCGMPNCQDFLESIADAPNRRARRGMISQQRRGPQAMRLFDQAQIAYNQAVLNRNVAVVNGNVAEVVYRGEPGIHVRWIDTERAVSSVMERVEDSLSPADRSKMLATDLYDHKIRGTSLRDVEQMSLPLSGQDIGRILRMTRWGFTDRFFMSKNTELVQEMVMTLPATDIARPGEVTIPQSIRPLHDRLTNFFDYYTSFFQQPYLEFDEQMTLAWAMTYGLNRFHAGIGMFLPARIGITPGSATKLIAEHLFSGAPVIGSFATDRYTMFLKNSYRNNGLPDNFASLQDYNPGRDKDFARAVLSLDQQSPLASLEGGVEETQAIFDNFRRFQLLVRGNILGAKSRQLVVPTVHPAFSEVKVATQYKNSLAFLVKLATGESMLVEVNGANRLFGIPYELIKEDPNIDAKFVKAILEPFVDLSRKLHPEKAQRPVITVSSNKPVKIATLKKPTIEDTFVEIEAKPPKRKRLFASQAPQTLPEAATERQQVFRVDYTKTSVAELLKLPHDHELVERFMEAIKGFEWGEKQAKNIKAAPGHVRIRVGKRRIALEHLGGTSYALKAIDPRSEVYSKKGLSGLG